MSEYPATHPAIAPQLILETKDQTAIRETPKPVNMKGLFIFFLVLVF
jgi:hypothetical protein